MALANAIAAGFYLHYARTTIKSDKEYGRWLADNFDGSRRTAAEYVQLARAYVVLPGAIAPGNGIREAAEKARTIDVPKDLPAILSDYGKDPKEIEEREAKRLRGGREGRTSRAAERDERPTALSS